MSMVRKAFAVVVARAGCLLRQDAGRRSRPCSLVYKDGARFKRLHKARDKCRGLICQPWNVFVMRIPVAASAA